jgi:ABC-type taurine transport system ATPase subunit
MKMNGWLEPIASRNNAIGQLFQSGYLDLYRILGEFLVLVGPSGCGKTAFISVVAGLVQASRGRVLVGGKPIAGPGAARAMVFQEHTE